MLKELYLRDTTDPIYNDQILEHSDELETLIGEIKMLLFTRQGDVLGSYEFGYNLEDDLYLHDLNEKDLRNKLIDNIFFFCRDAKKYNTDVSVQFFKGSVRDVCLIDIFINSTKTLGILVK